MSPSVPPSASNVPAGDPAPATGVPAKSPDLEIKDAQLIFESVWEGLEVEFGLQNLRFPKEITLLGGAPGAGKGTNTSFILRTRGLTCPPVVVSALLDSPDARRNKDAGYMVGDREVVSILFRHLLRPKYRDGCILDGFPRTKVQVECLKLLVDRMRTAWREFAATPLSLHFRQPTIHIMVLFVDEKTSVERQLKRGRQVRRTGIGSLLEERPTDYDENLARRRYRVFKEQTWEALQSLRNLFHYHFVDAQGSVQEVEYNILTELQYQSSLELDPRTFDRVRRLPLASEIVLHARQELVKRLDSYEFDHAELFQKVVAFIDKKMMPIIKRHAISGLALINSEELLLDDPIALAMLIDIFSERGFHAVVDVHRLDVPEKVDPATGQISSRVKKVYRFRVQFPGSEIRRG